MNSHNIQEVLGVDVGAVRIGVARGSTLARIAQPLRTLPADKAIEQIGSLAKLHGADAIIVGLPRNLSGDETVQTEFVKSWAQRAQGQINLPFFWQDEALTSQKAQDLKPTANNVGLDAQAAAIILQDFLDAHEDDRVAI